MGILHVTNLTDDPYGTIRRKFLDAFEEVEKELNVKIPESEQYDYIEREIELLEEQAEETMGKDLLGLIDNYIVNLDYYSQVRDWYESINEQ